MVLTKNGNGNGVKVRELIIRILTWLIPIGFVAGGVIAISRATTSNLPDLQRQVHQQDKTLGNHELRITFVEDKVDEFTKEQKTQTKLLRDILAKP